MTRARSKQTTRRSRQDHSSPAAKSRRSINTIRLQRLLIPTTAALVSALIVISFLVPADAKSVFLGEALPQNLLWLIAGVLVALAARVNRAIQLELAPFQWIGLLTGGVWLILSCFFADDLGNGRAAWNGFWQVASFASCFAILTTLSRDARFARSIIAILIACSLAMSVHGIHQVTVSLPQERAKYATDPESMLRAHGIDAPEGSAMRKRFEDRLQSNEPFASFALANSLATELSAALILIAGVLFRVTSQSQVRDSLNAATANRAHGIKALRISALTTMFFVVVACWILTKSRSSYLAVTAAVVVWIAMVAVARRGSLRAKASKLGIFAVIALVLCGLAWMLVSDQLILSEALKSLAFRLEYWRATWLMIVEHWLWGVGLGNYQSYYPQYKLATASEIIADPHNWLLDVAATMSVPVAGLIVVWLLRSMLLPRRVTAVGAREMLPGVERVVLIGAGIGWVVGVGLLQLTGQSIDWKAGLYAWSAAALSVWLLTEWIDHGELCEQALCASILAMIIGLLASGSWQASGVGIPLMCLLGIRNSAGIRAATSAQRLAQTESLDELVRDTHFDSKHTRKLNWSPVALAATGLLVFMLHTWRPTSVSWTLHQQSLRTSNLDDAMELAKQAATADPLDPVPLVSIVQIMSVRLSNIRSEAEFQQQATLVDGALDHLLKSDSASHLNWQLAGNTAFNAAAAAQRISASNVVQLKQAAEYYTEAARRYPGSVQLRIQLATALGLLQDWTGSKREVDEALQISGLTQHEDQKLKNQQIWLPMAPSAIPKEVIERPPGDPNWANAEPIANWLRSN